MDLQDFTVHTVTLNIAFSTSKWFFLIWAPINSSIYYTNLLTQQSPYKTLPWSPQWHFQVFTVVTNIEGKQQTEPLPVSASHWETNLKTSGRALITAVSSEQLRSDNSMVLWFSCTEQGHLRIKKNKKKKTRSGSTKRDLSTAGTRNRLKLTVKQ